MTPDEIQNEMLAKGYLTQSQIDDFYRFYGLVDYEGRRRSM